MSGLAVGSNAGADTGCLLQRGGQRFDVGGRRELGSRHQDAGIELGIEAPEIDAAEDAARLQLRQHVARAAVYVDGKFVEERRLEFEVDSIDARDGGRELARTLEIQRRRIA